MLYIYGILVPCVLFYFCSYFLLTRPIGTVWILAPIPLDSARGRGNGEYGEIPREIYREADEECVSQLLLIFNAS